MRRRSGCLVRAPYPCAALLTGAPWRTVTSASHFGADLNCSERWIVRLSFRFELSGGAPKARGAVLPPGFCCTFRFYWVARTDAFSVSMVRLLDALRWPNVASAKGCTVLAAVTENRPCGPPMVEHHRSEPARGIGHPSPDLQASSYLVRGVWRGCVQLRLEMRYKVRVCPTTDEAPQYAHEVAL